jgi:hypothetical protein
LSQFVLERISRASAVTKVRLQCGVHVHPIQYRTPLWQELARRPGFDLTVFYFSKHGVVPAVDPGFGVAFAWDIYVLAGHENVFLPRCWPTRDPLDYGAWALNRGILAALRKGWDAVFIAGYAHANNWLTLRPAGCWAFP